MMMETLSVMSNKETYYHHLLLSVISLLLISPPNLMIFLFCLCKIGYIMSEVQFSVVPTAFEKS